MIKLTFAALAAIAFMVQTAGPVRAGDPTPQQLVDSKGHAAGTEIKTRPAQVKTHATAKRRIHSSGRRSGMVQTIHQAARRQ